MPRYLPTSQKPLSFTCESSVAPDEMAITTSARCGSLISRWRITGAMRPAAVIMATVAEPCVTRTAAASSHASRMGGMAEPAIETAIASPMPLAVIICLRTPPAPVIRMMMPAGPRARVLSSRICSFFIPLRMPRK